MALGKVNSLNDKEINPIRIRRDQFKRLQRVVRDNAEFPIIALGLVKDYAKGRPEIAAVTFDNPDNPTAIWLYTQPNDLLDGTRYEFTFKRAEILPVPTLD